MKPSNNNKNNNKNHCKSLKKKKKKHQSSGDALSLSVAERRGSSCTPAWSLASGLRCTAALARRKLLNAAGARIAAEVNPAS